jgi:choline-glycine betaine transporter
VIGIISGVAVALFLVTFITLRRISKLFGILSSISLQAKTKLLVSFYQIISSLEDFYGVKLDSRLMNWVKVFQSILSLDFCLFQYPHKLYLFNATTDYIQRYVAICDNCCGSNWNGILCSILDHCKHRRQ